MNVTTNSHWTLIIFVASLFCRCGNAPSSQTPSAQQSTEISILLWDSLLAAHPDAILLDVRSDEEWEAGHLANASYVSFDWDHRLEPLALIPWDRPVFVYCEAGGRSGVVTEELRIIGHPQIFDLIGGMEQWMAHDQPLAFDAPKLLPQAEH